MRIRELFTSDVTRDIPPVIYFHEQSPERVAAELSEYIITGGRGEGPTRALGIHDQYVRLLEGVVAEVEKAHLDVPPAAWISGFYGSGKSSFAKLLGLALDDRALPDGRTVAEAWLARDRTPQRQDLVDVWGRLTAKVKGIAVVFDIGGVSRDNEDIHAAIVRQVQGRLGYCGKDAQVAANELKLERDGHWARFEQVVEAELGEPWRKLKGTAMAAESFSVAMHHLFPERFSHEMMWLETYAGHRAGGLSAEDSTTAIRDMLDFRAQGRTLFIVVDEVSQYIHQDGRRMLALQSFVSELQQRLKGRVWLMVTGQEQLEAQGASAALGKMKDRFPSKLRVHLGQSNIRDVVHRRLLEKHDEGRAAVRALYAEHQSALKLYAFQGIGDQTTDLTEEDFIEVYPMLPAHIDLVLKLTSALRARSTRHKQDDHAIRGLLQLLGELFRGQGLADGELGRLITVDQIYEVLHTALPTDMQQSMTRLLAQCERDEEGGALKARVGKAVALLQLLQDEAATTSALVARCLYDRLGEPSNLEPISAALEGLRQSNLMGYSEKTGYKLQSSAGEEWHRERQDIPVGREQLNAHIKAAMQLSLRDFGKPKLQKRAFPWKAWFSDGISATDEQLIKTTEHAAVEIDLRLPGKGEDEAYWLQRSAEAHLSQRLICVCGNAEMLATTARELERSRRMLSRYRQMEHSLSDAKRVLLGDERRREEDLSKALKEEVAQAWHQGKIYFRARVFQPSDHGGSFRAAVERLGADRLPELLPHFDPVTVVEKRIEQLLELQLTGLDSVFTTGLGLFTLEGGKYIASCNGAIPQRIKQLIEQEQGVSGRRLLTHFAGPPYAYQEAVIKVCVLGLLRGGFIHAQPERGEQITAARDAGTKELFSQARIFNAAQFTPATEGAVSGRFLAKACKLFKAHFGVELDRDAEVVADAMANQLVKRSQQVDDLITRLGRIRPATQPALPALSTLDALTAALKDCSGRLRRTQDALLAFERLFDAINGGLKTFSTISKELPDNLDSAIAEARGAREVEGMQLGEEGGGPALERALATIDEHLRAERPWLHVDALQTASAEIKKLYREARGRLIEELMIEADEARQHIKGHRQFHLLSPEQSNLVLRPISLATRNLDAEANEPALDQLRLRVQAKIRQGLEQAAEALDEVIEEITAVPTYPVKLKVHREITSQADFEQLIAEMRALVEPHLKEGHHVRLVRK